MEKPRLQKTIQSASPEQTAKIAQEILSETLSQAQSTSKVSATATILALQGNLGSGKTTFTQAVARELGITETVTSPTFVIQKNYTVTNQAYASTFKNLIHIDAYRIEDASELETIGFNKIAADPGNLILIEWPEKAKNLLPAEQTKTIKFTFVDDTTRLIEW